MPLPAALAARLAKRGLIKDQPNPPQKPKPVEEVEEVFAEDYDDPTKPEVEEEPSAPEAVLEEVKPEEAEEEEYAHEVVNCPNKWNPFHTCTKWCREHWGVKTFMPEPNMMRRRDRMLRKYPLPDGWAEVAEPETGRYYYWSMYTDQVSWLSPSHPSAIISMPADKIMDNAASPEYDMEDDYEDTEELEPLGGGDEPMEGDSEMSGSSSDSESEDERRRKRREPERGRQDRGGHQDNRRGRGRGRDRGRNQRDGLDPMDPASYSDIPRGGWTDGLDMRGSAKTGVDVTASGPLFQQRPYPSPGDILRANTSMKK